MLAVLINSTVEGRVLNILLERVHFLTEENCKSVFTKAQIIHKACFVVKRVENINEDIILLHVQGITNQVYVDLSVI